MHQVRTGHNIARDFRQNEAGNGERKRPVTKMETPSWRRTILHTDFIVCSIACYLPVNYKKKIFWSYKVKIRRVNSHIEDFLNREIGKFLFPVGLDLPKLQSLIPG
jgi:hypothetical protein